ncbi:RHS repeat domain-containing protein [Sphingobacterium thalpophilum]
MSQSKLSYNEIGQLKQKNLHNTGSTAVQEILYSYNERGWLKSVNSPAAVSARRVFGMELSYGDKTDSYNGNIGSMKWNTLVPSTMTMQPVQTYTYYYDRLNRLKRGTYINAASGSPANKAGHYDEELAYDVMGNIDSLRRCNGTGSGWYNNFKYTYSGNQLTKVTDAGTAARTNTFSYDANGNGITNSRLGIGKIEYNHLNLPNKLIKGSNSLIYSYDANGRKLSKTLGSAVTDYVDGIQYENGVLKFIQTEEGRILPNGSSYIYEYFLKDHLGNTRAVVDHSGTIKQIQDYYPFGMEMNQGNALNTASNLYKYNGKEKQVELGLDQLDYGARFYDAEIGRWNVVDPMAEKMRRHSPYNYAFSNPIRFIDPDGRAPIDPPTKKQQRVAAGVIVGGAAGGSIASTIIGGSIVAGGGVAGGGTATVFGAPVGWFVGGAIIVGGVVVGGTVALVENLMENSAPEPSSVVLSEGTKSNPTDRKLPRDKNGLPVRDPEAQDAGPHSQIGKKEGRNGDYKQVREFDKDGNPVKDIDFTDHGRPDTHPHNPHEHVYKPSKTGGTLQRDKTPAPLTYTDWINGLNK